jgi:ankyrin repeat protein
VAVLVVLGLAAATDREAPLVAAVKQGDATSVRTLLKQRIDVNAPDGEGTTALHWAAQRDDLTTVDLLIRAGASPKTANRYGITPLFLACTNGNVAIVERLLKAGADPKTSTPGGETALMTAARTGNADVLKMLLAHGADVNARETTRGQTALMWAAAQGNEAAIAILVEAGADVKALSHGPSRSDSKGSEPSAPQLNSALSRDYSRRGRIDAYTPLLFAARAGHTAAVRALLDAGAGVNETGPDGASALVIAAINAHWELGAFLLDRGADPNAAAQGWTALHQVVRTRTLSIGQFPHPVPTGRLSSMDFAKKLIAQGADVNARMTKDFFDGYRGRFNRIGATPLLLAAKGADGDMMRFLAANGADARLTNANNATILQVAAGVDMFYVNEDSGTNEDGLEAVKVAIELGSDVNAANDRGDTALHGAAARGSTPIVQLLVDKGARLDAKNKRGFTPVQVANGDENTGTFQRRPETVALFRELMTARGISVDESVFVSPTVRGAAGQPPEPKPTAAPR